MPRSKSKNLPDPEKPDPRIVRHLLYWCERRVLHELKQLPDDQGKNDSLKQWGNRIELIGLLGTIAELKKYFG